MNKLALVLGFVLVSQAGLAADKMSASTCKVLLQAAIEELKTEESLGKDEAAAYDLIMGAVIEGAMKHYETKRAQGSPETEDLCLNSFKQAMDEMSEALEGLGK